MSNLERDPAEDVCGGTAAVAVAPVDDLLPGREVSIGPRGMVVTRTLPHRDRRMVGAWCFIDHYGPHEVSSYGMRVPPHPHTGLQTVSWLLEGRVFHRDSLGNEQYVQPGELNLMTAGRAIVHAEESVAESAPTFHGVQRRVALRGASRHAHAHLAHHPDPPLQQHPGPR